MARKINLDLTMDQSPEEQEEMENLQSQEAHIMNLANEQGFGCFGCGGDLALLDFQSAHDDGVGHEVIVCSRCAKDYPVDDDAVVVSGPYAVHEHGSLEGFMAYIFG